jgi:hypothetical protein
LLIGHTQIKLAQDQACTRSSLHKIKYNGMIAFALGGIAYWLIGSLGTACRVAT